MNRLAAGLLELGVDCEFLLGESGSGLSGESIPSGVRVRVVDIEELPGLAADSSAFGAEPHAVLVFRTPDYTPVIRAVRAVKTGQPRLFIVNGDYLTTRLDPRSVGRIRAWKNRRRLRRDWARADGVITTCTAIADSWRRVGAFHEGQIHQPQPPVVGEDIGWAALEDVDYPWPESSAPLILGIGRLTPNKRFELLVEAFAQLREERIANLAIVGRGPEEGRLRALADSLDVGSAVAFPGFTRNPYAWMNHAAVIGLPSVVEPLGLVLIESLYVGRPFVAAGQPPGPSVIRDETGEGMILDADTPAAMARALSETLERPPEPERLRRAAMPYDYRISARAYRDILFPKLAGS